VEEASVYDVLGEDPLVQAAQRVASLETLDDRAALDVTAVHESPGLVVVA
jgi:hypothetical protein